MLTPFGAEVLKRYDVFTRGPQPAPPMMWRRSRAMPGRRQAQKSERHRYGLGAIAP